MGALSGKKARLKITAATPTSSTNEGFTHVAGSAGVNWQVTSTARRHLNAAPTNVTVGASTINPSGYVTNLVQGIITFATGQSTGATVQGDVAYLTASYVGGVRTWSVDASRDVLDATAFSTSTSDTEWRIFKDGLAGWTAALGRLPQGSTAPAFFDRFNAADKLIVELWPDQAVGRLEGFAYVSADDPGANIAELVAEDVTLQGTGDLYWTT